MFSVQFHSNAKAEKAKRLLEMLVSYLTVFKLVRYASRRGDGVWYCPSLRRHYPDQVRRVYLSHEIASQHPGTAQNYTFHQFQKNYLRIF
jgi:phosphoribosylanthranilate isomerase